MTLIKDTQSNSPSASTASASRLRATLLGAVAILALGGVGAETALMSIHPVQAAQIAAEPAPGQIAPSSFADVVARVSPAVVSVKVRITGDAAPAGQDGEGPLPNIPKDDPRFKFFQQFGQGEGAEHPHPRVGMAQGSGFFISKDGYVVTNNHVVDHASDVELTLQNGDVVAATVIGTDKKTDLALLKAKTGDNYSFVTWGDHMPRVGDWVMAVGNPFGLGGTVTAGIVSARGRDIGSGPYDDFLQIDAPVNHGNSGGPTFNTQGEVVGINTAIVSPSGGSVGIGFAIPAEEAKAVIAQLKSHGVVDRGWLGLQIQPVSADIADSLGLKDPKGALVSEPQKGSPAADAGIKAGDVVLAVNGEAVAGPRELSRSIATLGPAKTAELTIWRDGAYKTIAVKLGNLPADRPTLAKAPARQDQEQLTSLGMTLVPSSAVPGGSKVGVTIAQVDENGVAARTGLSAGDVILEASGKTVSVPSDVTRAFNVAKTDDKPVLLRVKSGDAVRFVALAAKTLG